MIDIPNDYRKYAPVLSRLGGPYRKVGGGLNMRCPFGERHAHGDANPSAFVKIGWRGELVAFCNGCRAAWPEFVELVGLPPQAWFPGAIMSEQQPAVKSKVVATYEYHDRDGAVVAVKLRWEPGFDGLRSKDFTWRRPIPPQLAWEAYQVPEHLKSWAIGDGLFKSQRYAYAEQRAKDVYFRKTDDIDDERAIMLPPLDPGIYRRHLVAKANVDHPILVVEGEGKADLLASMGFIATTGYAGKGKWNPVWSADFKGRRVVVIPDRDPRDSAMDYGHAIMASAIYYQAASVRLVEIPLGELKPQYQGGDIKDWLGFRFPAGGSDKDKKDAVVRLCQRFPEWCPKGEVLREDRRSASNVA